MYRTSVIGILNLNRGTWRLKKFEAHAVSMVLLEEDIVYAYRDIVEADDGTVISIYKLGFDIHEAKLGNYYNDIAFWTSTDYGIKYLDEIIAYFTFMDTADGWIIDKPKTREVIAEAVRGGYFDGIAFWNAKFMGVKL